ncbi:MAG TPA: hypothetical protein VGK67_08660 [Myxococcales bacterium]|jgi:hypothetical protein
MDALFSGLTKRQAMLLLTAVAFGGQEGVDSFEFLTPDEAELLRDRAAQILAIPRDKRVAFLAQEIKRLITTETRDMLLFADPKVVSEVLAKERPAMVEVLLRALPSAVADEVRNNLAQPVVELKHEPRRDVLRVIRWKFEEQLARKVPQITAFSMSDLMVMPSKDLLYLADVLGARSLSNVLAPLPDAEREEVLKKLAPEQRQVASKPVDPSAGRRLNVERARNILDKHFRELEPKRAVRLMGVRRIAKACLAQSGEFAARVIEQHRDELGRQLAHFVSEERQKGSRGDPGARDEVLAELAKLATRGVVEKPVRLPPPPMMKRPSVGEPRELGVATAKRPSAPPRPSGGGGPPPTNSRDQVTIQRGGAAAVSRQPSHEQPVRRPSVVRTNPVRGPRKP